ncbi:hypothetical protein OG481_21835 [Streptomyces longwoodensis]|uniref:DUF6571 family protein n=1 Tax=Streptomyces longwoodensis TaxID=68231 RepID=UPI002DDB8586|nr:DUF6571 family protein [Streptomyces longwoodensis]WRY90980.1 hypothetical protein OG481_21835 [Streptomyces longwoodensis]
MNFETLFHANFSLLDDAVTDWATLVRNLGELKKDAETNLHQAANKANWAGMNQQVSKEFIGKTAGEFADAHTQASTIHQVLSDTLGELRGYHRQLTTAVENGRKRSLSVFPSGDAFMVTSSVPPQTAAAGEPDRTADVTALRDEIQGILDKATESDNSAGTVLKALADQSELGFSDARYKDRDSAAAALKKADELARLAKKDPGELTTAEFDLLNAGLKQYANDHLFAERFATDLGARGTLDFWTGLNDVPGAGDVGQRRHDRYDDLQKSLGLTLATASQSDSAGMAEWKGRMVDLADKPVGRAGGFPLGAQVMTNLMRWGDYDDRFLVDYGDKLIETEKKFTGNGRHGAWSRTGGDPLLNRTGTDSGWDPMTGYLRALSNNPDAATEFFNDTFVTKDEDHDFTQDADGNGKQEKRALSNFDYLFEERDWPQDVDDKGEESIAGRNYLGMALEAATTGHPAGELRTMDTPVHHDGQTKLFEAIVASVSDDGTRLTDHPYMSDSMGQIASEYLPDIDRAATDVDPHPGSNDTSGRQAWDRIQKLYPVAGSAAELNHRDSSRFLFALGQNSEGYAAVEVAQKKYMSDLMEYHLNPDLPESQRPHHDLRLTVQAIAGHSGEVSGTLAMGRNEAIAGPASVSDDDYDHAVNQWKNVASGAIGTGVGVGTSFIASPAVGAGAGGVAGTVTSVVLEEMFKDVEGNEKDNAGPKMGENWENGQDNNLKYTRNAAAEAMRKYRLAHSDDLASVAESEASKGYLRAGNYMDRVAPELLTEI